MRDVLNDRGWVTFRHSGSTDSLSEALYEIGTSLGQPCRTPSRDAIEVLRVQTTSPRPSLSRTFGSGRFPFHTDCAHWTAPPRFLCLACIAVGAGHRATYVAPFDALGLSTAEHRALARGVFTISNGRHSFLSTVTGSGPFVRFDPGCMRPSTREAEVLSCLVERKCESVASPVDWEEGQILILDNWRVLHARGAAAVESESRVLARMYVEQIQS